ncbi:MAG TPA: acetyl-coenzyme A synthetase N-terminal domain-containing protein, partial [Solimonas sp.]|nr:acetyl-coenzyme A synthetase N-terminal domain-containing protein [Solimonas sp.]
MIQEGELLWSPRPEFAQNSGIAGYLRWLAQERGLKLADYDALWRWSVDETEAFWASVWDYFGVISTTPYTRVLDRREMPGNRWFEGSQVNYAEHLLRHEERLASQPVFHHLSETRPLAQMSWGELGRQVRILATQLRALGIGPGDRVVSYMPNVPETA